MSSSVISLFNLFLNGSSPSSIVEITSSHVVFSSISLYILFSINILSSEMVCHWFSSSVSWISNSFFNRSLVLSVEILSISLTPKNCGLFWEIIQHNGDIETSHCVNAYNESMLFWIEDPEGRYTRTSTSDEVLSSIFFIFNFPFSEALIIDSIKEAVVVPYGISLIIITFFSYFSTLALTLTLPPLFPSL